MCYFTVLCLKLVLRWDRRNINFGNSSGSSITMKNKLYFLKFCFTLRKNNNILSYFQWTKLYFVLFSRCVRLKKRRALNETRLAGERGLQKTRSSSSARVSFCLAVCLSVYVCVSVFLSVCLCLSVSVCVHFRLYLANWIACWSAVCVCLRVYMAVRACVSLLSVCLYPSTRVFICLSARLSVYVRLRQSRYFFPLVLLIVQNNHIDSSAVDCRRNQIRWWWKGCYSIPSVVRLA